MKIQQSIIDYIENVVKTGLSINIENVIIEGDAVRAIDEDRTVVIYQNSNIPELPFESLGLSRSNDFLSRLDIAKLTDNFSMDLDVDGEYVRSIVMKSKRLKISYRCANPSVIQAPRQINDKLIYKVKIDSEAVALLQKGQSAMKTELVSFISDGDNNVKFVLEDINSDVFECDLTSSAESLTDETSTNFTHKYRIKTILSLFKQNPEGFFEIGQKGILQITVNDLDIYVLPQI